MVCNHVNEFNGARLFSQFPDDILLVFPPLDLIVGFKVKIFSVGTVKLLEPGFDIDLDSGLSTY
jgi:hypothetical protein